jgi:hypothetical protein
LPGIFALKGNVVKNFHARKTAFWKCAARRGNSPRQGRWNVATGEAQLAVRQAKRNPWKTSINESLTPAGVTEFFFSALIRPIPSPLPG